MTDTEQQFEDTLLQRIRWWWQRRRKAYQRPVYSNGETPHPSCNHRWRTEDRRPPGITRDMIDASDWRRKWYVNVICTRCRAVRCGDSRNPNPCVLHRHHRGAHRYDD